MKFTELDLDGVLLVEPDVYEDERGHFLETWNERRYARHGIDKPFVQDNLSWSRKNTLRGLHYQNPHPQGKLVFVLTGTVFDVVVDIRAGSRRFGQWIGIELSHENKRQLYVPEGYAHGFVVVSDGALFAYKCTDFYVPDCQGSVRWDDPEIGIEWPVAEPILNPKDRHAPPLASLRA